MHSFDQYPALGHMGCEQVQHAQLYSSVFREVRGLPTTVVRTDPLMLVGQ